MWAGIATPEQAERMVKENLLDEKAFWAPAGVRTLSKYEKMYVIKESGNPSCWLGPVWGISNYMVFRGLVKYGFTAEAVELANKNIGLLASDISDSGELHEYYDPESGRPIMNPGFQNWNLLSLNMQAWLDGKPVSEEF
jgi:putative isomerase